MAIFKGAGVAIVTPFHEDGSVNFEKFAELVEFQIQNGTDAIIVCGTTGESSTLTHEEHLEVIKFCAETVKGSRNCRNRFELYGNSGLSFHGSREIWGGRSFVSDALLQ